MQDKNEKKSKAVDEMLADFVKKSDAIKGRLQIMPGMPKCMPAECRTLWNQVVLCFMFGFDYAALATSGAFVESLLEKAIPQFRALKGEPATPAPRGLAKRLNVSMTIGLTSDEEAAILDQYRDLVRNPFSHGNIDRLANLYSKVKSGTFVWIEDGQVKSVSEFGKDDIEAVSKATVRPRAERSARKIAPRVLYWVAMWAADCAKKAWPEK